MMTKIIDNQKRSLAEFLREEAPKFKHLSIATGYWDLEGTLEIINEIKDYQSIRLLIGAEPYCSRRVLGSPNLYANFPEEDITSDLTEIRKEGDKIEQLRETAKILAKLINNGVLKVRICRKPFLHAKAYIFGTYDSESAIGVIGSSNFTGRGLRSRSEKGNAELNAVENDPRIVFYTPQNETQQHGHLSWFDSFWNSDDVEEWSGTFSQIVQNSPVGDLTFGPYDSYIKALMECFPDELVKMPELEDETKDILFKYQERNASILINKLEKMGMAILADSVGLGKTITAGAVIDHYISSGRDRIVIIVPASLKEQWKDDLKSRFKRVEGFDYQLVSQQDVNLIRQKIDDYRGVKAKVDLFVIDEAHNLRNEGSERHEAILDWLKDNQESKVLMLTATPINNSLRDLVHLITLGLKGSLDSVSVPFKDNNEKIKTIDFLEALARIEKASKNPDFRWEDYKQTLVSGISRYLVRSTRQGVEAEGSLVTKDGIIRKFPKSEVKNKSYKYSEQICDEIARKIDKASVFGDIKIRNIDLDSITEKTQRTKHPLDFANEYLCETTVNSVIPNIFQLISIMGFTMYRPDVYKHEYYGKSSEDIKKILENLKKQEALSLNIQLIVHNILQVTWLKRLESSTNSLIRSVAKYRYRINKFTEYLDKGFILSFKDLSILENEYDDDLERAFEEWDKYIENVKINEDPEELKARGIERRLADPKKYKIDQLRLDAERDRKICDLIEDCLTALSGEHDSKMISFVEDVKSLIKLKKYGKKVLVFSFFADTIDYLKQNLKFVLNKGDDIFDRSEFIHGQNSGVDAITKRFSPKSKNYIMQPDDKEIDYLFATDVLSEGQNLQDAAILINYDLHWNPVRMIQRNGRINRLGSEFAEVLISNMTPEDNIELYLKLITRLVEKISKIKNTVGLDQAVLSNDDINPIEFIENIKSLYGSDPEKATKAMNDMEQDNDILSWTNDHLFVLRDFLNSESEERIEEIKNIPLGKWSYLPAQSAFDKDHIISLQRAVGKKSITKQPIIQTFFMKTVNGDRYGTELMEEQEALEYIKTNKNDNKRKKDRIVTDRKLVAKRAANAAKRRAESTNAIFQITKSQEEALLIIRKYIDENSLNLGTDSIRSVIEYNLRDSQSRRKYLKLVREIRRQNKELGCVNRKTINEFSQLIKELHNLLSEDFYVDSVDDVLYFVKEK